MATILDLQDRGLRYGVIVDAAATTATLAAIERAGLRYKVEVASGITAADRATLDRRGLQYFVPVAATVSMADRAILERQGLRYAVQVDPTVLPADLAALERQGLSYFVEVDSSGTAIATAAGGAILLVDEANGFATDFTHPVDAERVAVKTAGTVVASTVDGFFTNAGTSPKMVYDSAGTLVWSPHNMLLQSAGGRSGFLWTGNGSTRTTSAQMDPSGGFEALQVVCTANVGLNVYSGVIGPPIGTLCVASMWCKGTLGQQIYFFMDSNTVGADQILVTFTGEWQRVSHTRVATTASPYIGFELYNRSGGAHLPSITFHVWGGQYQRGTTPTTYLPTTTAARYGLALDYDPVTHAAKGLLCEPAATNRILQSAAPATQGVTVTAAAHTLSFFGTGTLTLTGTSTAGPLVGTGANNRVSLTFTPTAGTLTLTKSGTVTQAQLETGTVATSYIPTLAASVTRAVDVIKVTPASIGYSATAGSWWLDLSLNAFVSGAGRIICNRTGSNTPLFTNTTTQFGLYDGVAFMTRSVGSVTGSHKLAAAFQSADRAITADALTVITDTQAGTALLSPGVDIGIGCDPNGVDQINGYIRKLRYVPRRKSNAELVTETT